MSETLPLNFTEERWRRLESLFHAAADLSDQDRESFIGRELASDRALELELRAMLLHAAGARNRIAGTIQRVAGQAACGRDWVGRHFGPYRIIREIGRGGMGLVFEAWRDDAEYGKRVALKVAPDWRDLEQLRERFRNERQILARLEHPNIARFLDGGTDDGVPYFAMEYIDGKPVTEWVRERNLGLRERIRLFRQICAAVSCAHENLVIHRDLKPSNILVDRTDTVKLLDFGIATLFSPIVEQSTEITGVRLWTPDYSSPELIRGGVITVRTDVYSLGLVLYELLCGERAQIADPSSPLALDRSICDVEPVLPSIRAAVGGQTNLSRQLKGDLDTIVAMAIHKEPERRYRSVAALDADLARYLDGRAVEARTSTPAYRFSKFLRRHRMASVAVAVVIVSVIGGVASTLYQARRAERRFEQVRSLANAFVFDVHDRIQFLPGSTDARKVIVSTALRYLENLRQEAGSDAVLLRELAAAYQKIGDVQGNPGSSNLGDSAGALTSYRRAESILTPLAARGDPEAKFALTANVDKLGNLQHVQGDSAGQGQLERARVMARELAASKTADIRILGLAANINADLTRLYADARTPQRARETAQEAAELAQRMVNLRPGSQESLDFLALSHNSLASAYRASGDPQRSADTYRAALEIREQLVRDHPENAEYRRLLLITYGHLGDALGPPEAMGLGQLAASVDAFKKAAEIADWISQRDPQDRKSWFDLVAAHMRAAASLLEEPDGGREAQLHLAKSESLLALLTRDDPSNQRYRFYAFVLDCHMGKALAAVGKNQEAMGRLERARSAIQGFRGGPSENSARGWGIGASLRLGQLKAKTDRPTAVALADETAAVLLSSAPALGNDWTKATFYAHLGSLYLETENSKSATVWLEKSAALWRRMTVPAVLEAQRQKALAAVEHDLDNR